MGFNFTGKNNTEISEFIKRDGTISIGKRDWEELQKSVLSRVRKGVIKKTSPEESDEDAKKRYIKQMFCDEMFKYKSLKMLSKGKTLGEAESSFRELQKYVPNPFGVENKENVYTRYPYKTELSGRYIEEPNVGRDASDYFQESNRFKAHYTGHKSVEQFWNDEKLFNTTLNALFSLKKDKVDSGSLIACANMALFNPSQFNPAIAKSIYTKFNSKDILDTSAGWGDRLCAFFATEGTKSYIGIDPNTKVYGTYYKQIEAYEDWGVRDKKVTLYNLPAEDVTLEEEIVDTVFTSPPYFGLEIYCDEPTQSFARYNEVDRWLKGFMFPTLDLSWKALKHGGHLIINMSDALQKGEVNKICDPMVDYIRDTYGVELKECLGMKLNKRASPSENKDTKWEKTLLEPVWVWEKP